MPEISRSRFEVPDLLAKSIDDDIVLRHFASVWTLVANALEAFSESTGLQLFVYYKNEQIYTSSSVRRPAICQFMLSGEDTRRSCCVDGQRRANREEPDIAKGLQLCHAGLLNGRKEIHSEMGTIVLLYGSLESDLPEAISRRNVVLAAAQANTDPLRDWVEPTRKISEISREPFEPSSSALLDALCNLIERLLRSTVGFRVLAINMAHELIFTLSELGHIAELNAEVLTDNSALLDETDADDFAALNAMLVAESRLGLYLVRNILSHTSESAYAQVTRPSFAEVDMARLLTDMVELYKWRAREKQIDIEMDNVADLPSIRGFDLEIRRALHNVLNNALKYSYRSIRDAHRVIKIRFKVPYDPGFKRRSFAVIIENYGLGLDEGEVRTALRAGFRGRQAVREVPIGAGIGLSEVDKIMRLHRGSIKVLSKPLHGKEYDKETYLTQVSLIFPMLGERK